MAAGLSQLISQLGAEVIPSVFAAAATDTANVLRVARTPLGGGVTSEAFAAINTVPVPCIWEPKQFSRQMAADKWESVTGYAIYFTGGVDVRADDRIEIVARDASQPRRVFTVFAIADLLGVMTEVRTLSANLPDDGDQN